MIFIVWITNDIHIDFNDIHWEGCLHITRRRGGIRSAGNLEQSVNKLYKTEDDSTQTNVSFFPSY